MFNHISFLFSADSDWSYGFFSLAATALFFLGYWLLMRKEKRHQMVRFYLLGTLALSMLLPLVHIRVTDPAPAVEETTAQPSAAGQTVVLDQAGGAGQPAQAEPAAPAPAQPETLDQLISNLLWTMALLSLVVRIYLAGAVVMLVLFIVRLVRLGRQLRQLDYIRRDGYRLALVEGDQPAFSFFRTVVIGRDHFSDAEIEQLLGHELVHVRRHHSLDVLFCEVMKVLCWFNPFVWLYARELKRVHEFQADEQMMGGANAAAYAELFYHQIAGHRYSALGNNFDYRITPKRIQMMKQPPKRFGSLSLLVVLPVAALVLFVNCRHSTGFSGKYYVSNIVMTHDDANHTGLTCGNFLNLEDRTFTFHEDGTVDVLCKADKSANFRGTYTLDNGALRIFGPDGRPWINMNQMTNYCDKDSICLFFSDDDPVRGLETMVRTLSVNARPTYTATVSTSGGLDDDGNPVNINPHEVVDTIYPHISITAPSYDFMTQNNWFFNNRLLLSSTNFTTISGSGTEKDADGNPRTIFFSQWDYPEGRVHPGTRIMYDTLSAPSANPKRDDYRFQLRIEMKRQ